jgi:hypothetical protein
MRLNAKAQRAKDAKKEPQKSLLDDSKELCAFASRRLCVEVARIHVKFTIVSSLMANKMMLTRNVFLLAVFFMELSPFF